MGRISISLLFEMTWIHSLIHSDFNNIITKSHPNSDFVFILTSTSSPLTPSSQPSYPNLRHTAAQPVRVDRTLSLSLLNYLFLHILSLKKKLIHLKLGKRHSGWIKVLSHQQYINYSKNVSVFKFCHACVHHMHAA